MSEQREAATPQAPDVLLVCTGNVRRSPIAETFLRHRLAELGSDVVLHSAGLRPGGERLDNAVLKVLRRRGFRLRAYRSTALTPQLLSDADLVLGMASEHVQEIVRMAPERWPRVFTLKELIRRSDAIGGRRPEETFDGWLARVHTGRTMSDLKDFSPRDDISDPVGRSLADYEDMADKIEAVTKRLADLLTGRQSVPTIGRSANFVSDEPDWSMGVGDHSAEEKPMKAENREADRRRDTQDLLSPTGAAVEGLWTAREALQAAQEAVMGTARQLAEVLRSATDAQPVAADAYTQLGDEVAAVMRSAAADASALREEAEAVAKTLRSKANEQAKLVLDEANEKAGAVTAEALAERQQASIEAADIRRTVRAETADLRDEADLYAKSTRQQADADANHLRDEADRYARNVRGIAEVQGAEVLDKAEHDAAAIRQAAEDHAHKMRSEAEQEATELVGKASARYAELVGAERELRSRLQGAAGALVSALEGPHRVLSSPLALAGPDEEERD